MLAKSCLFRASKDTVGITFSDVLMGVRGGEGGNVAKWV